VVGSGRSPNAPPGVCGVRDGSGRSSPPPGRPSQGCPASRSSLLPTSAAHVVRRPLLAVVFGHEVFRRPVSFGPASEAAPSGLGPSQGAASRFRVPASRPGPSPPGVSRPSDDVRARIRFSRGCLPGTFRPRGFSPPRRVALRARRGLEGRCRPWGSDADPRPLRPPSRAVSTLPWRRRFAIPCRGVSAPPALRNRR
jgi:hypothetical protein